MLIGGDLDGWVLESYCRVHLRILILEMYLLAPLAELCNLGAHSVYALVFPARQHAQLGHWRSCTRTQLRTRRCVCARDLIMCMSDDLAESERESQHMSD